MRGKEVFKIDEYFPSSKMCNVCDCVQNKMPLDVRVWTCPHCGDEHDRDLNAAKNILAAGQAVTAHGDGVRAKQPNGCWPTICEVRTNSNPPGLGIPSL